MSAPGAVDRIGRALLAHPIAALTLAGIAVFAVNFFAGHPGISGWDANFYYAYAASIAERGSLDVGPVYARLAENGADIAALAAIPTTASGAAGNYFPAGHPLLHTPAVALGLLVQHVSGGEVDALGVLPQFLYCLSCLLGASLGLALVHRRLTQSHGPEAAAYAIVALVGASMLGYYWFVLPALSHTSSILLAGIAFELAHDARERLWRLIGFGLALGYMAAIRLQDVGFVLAAMVMSTAVIRSDTPATRKVVWLIAFGLAGLIGFLPQAVVWRLREGEWLHFAYDPAGSFDFARPHLVQVLFSMRHGLFVWHPVLLAAIVGAGLAVVRSLRARDESWPAIAAFGAAIVGVWYVGASYSIWWFGDSFGSRPFLSVAPLFAIGLAELWRRSAGKARVALLTVTGLLVAWNAWLAIAYHLAWISRSGPLEFPGFGR